MRRTRVALAAGVATLAVLATTALPAAGPAGAIGAVGATAKGGWATSTLDEAPRAEPGGTTEIGFTILQHGRTPVDVDDVAVVVRDGGTEGRDQEWPAVREAVADWLGIGGTEVVRVGVGEGDPGDLPYLGDVLVPVDRQTAEGRLGADLPDTGATELGPAPVLATPPEGGVVLAWDDGATTLWIRPTERSPSETVTKLLTFDGRLERIDGLGEDAAIVEGPHVLGTPQRRLAAGTVLIWVDDRFEHRLESDLEPERLVEIAHAIERG